MFSNFSKWKPRNTERLRYFYYIKSLDHESPWLKLWAQIPVFSSLSKPITPIHRLWFSSMTRNQLQMPSDSSGDLILDDIFALNRRWNTGHKQPTVLDSYYQTKLVHRCLLYKYVNIANGQNSNNNNNNNPPSPWPPPPPSDSPASCAHSARRRCVRTRAERAPRRTPSNEIR